MKRNFYKSEEKRLLKEILYNSLSQAFIRAIQTPHLVVKAFLVFFIILSSTLAAYYIIGTIISYLNYDVITTSRTIYETAALFPKITICNRNKFQSQFALDFLKQINKEINTTRNVNFFVKEEIERLKLKEKKALMDEINTSANGKITNGFNVTLRQKLGHGIKNILISCKFDYQDCSHADFKWTFDPLYGNCYEFNSGIF
jgi:hypothetical protein